MFCLVAPLSERPSAQCMVSRKACLISSAVTPVRMDDEGFVSIGQVQLVKTRRLSGSRQDGAPPAAQGIETLGLGAEQLDRHMNEAFVQKSDDDSGLTRHRGMDRVARIEIAKDCVLRIRGATPDLIARVEVTNHNWDPFLLEEGFDLLPQERADVSQLHIAGGIASRGICFQ